MEERIRELYQAGKGIKAISKELDVPPATVRRKLIAMNIYEGIAHGVVHEEETARETGEQLIGFSVSGEEEVTRTAEKLNLPPWSSGPAEEMLLFVRMMLGGLCHWELVSMQRSFPSPWKGSGAEKE